MKEHVAKAAAEALLCNIGYLPLAEVAAVPLEEVAASLGLEIRRRRTAMPGARGATLWTGSNGSSEKGGTYIDLASSGNRARFAIAHEVAHRLLHLDTRLGKQLSGSRETEMFCNRFAGHLLLPDALLWHLIDERRELTLTLDWILEASRRVSASVAVLLGKLNHLALTRKVVLRNCAIEVAARQSKKRALHYAPRIVILCKPREWFIPTDKRLSSLGMRHLANAFWNSQPYVRSIVEDTVTIWEEGRPGRTRTVTGRVHFVVLGTEQRVLVAVFGGPSEQEISTD